MDELIHLKKTVLGYEISVYALKAGTDWSVTVLGGCLPHVGSVSLAEYENAAVAVCSILRESHKDQIVGERFARKLAEQGRCNVSVCCGIHYEKPSQDDLVKIVDAADELLEELCGEIESAE